MFETPVLFLVFNRPEHTAKVFERIRQLKPCNLYVVADGPRVGVQEDIEKCKKVRHIIQNGVSWKCSLKIVFRDENLGCGPGVTSGINWFFDNVDRGIILEDDCIPDPSFFPFCESLLEKYADDERMMSICGSNFQFGRKRGNGSYYFSRYSHVWGWATWKRAWAKYSFDMPGLGRYLESEEFHQITTDEEEREFWINTLRTVQAKKDTWDYQWQYAHWKYNGLIIVPNVNLVTNVGFGAGATHTVQAESRVSNIPVGTVEIIRHPQAIRFDKKADQRFFKMAHLLRPHADFTHRVVLYLRKIFRKNNA